MKNMSSSNGKVIYRKDPFLKFCRHVVNGHVCTRRRCPYIHNLLVKIPCTYKKCKFGHGRCVYQHPNNEGNFSTQLDDMRTQLQSHLELVVSYELSKFQTMEVVMQNQEAEQDVVRIPRTEDPVLVMQEKALVSKVFEDECVQTEFEIENVEKLDLQMASTQEKRKCFCGGKNCPVCRKGERDSFDVEEDEDEDEDADEDEDLEQYYSKVEKRLDFDGMSESSDECIPNMPLRHGCCGCTQSGCVACEREGFCGLYYCSRCMPSHFNTPFQRGRGRVWSGRRGGAGWNSGRSREYGIRGRGRPPGRSIPYSPPKW